MSSQTPAPAAPIYGVRDVVINYSRKWFVCGTGGFAIGPAHTTQAKAEKWMRAKIRQDKLSEQMNAEWRAGLDQRRAAQA
jgi:hypothetical protein